MDKSEQFDLYMPSGVRLKKEYFRGYGKEELIPTIMSAFIFIILDAIIYIIGIRNIGVFFLVPICGVSAVAMMLVKGELNISPVDIIKMELSFIKSQKYYPYIAMDEWKHID